MRRISSLSERPEPHGLRRLVQRINPAGNGRVHSRVDRRLGTAARAQGPWPARARASNGTGAFPECSIRHLRESGLRENCTSRLRGGRRPALRGASNGTGAFPESSIRHLRESGLRENCTSRLRGGRRPALGHSSDETNEQSVVCHVAELAERRAGRGAPPPTRQ